jgi:hypothetical protein
MSGNSKNVKKILLKGADKTIKNIKDQTPLETAQELEFSNIKKMLENQRSVAIYCNIK